jgi:predicted ATPase/class 3 adenylate cyclase
MDVRPTGTVTFLFTDVEGSTRHAQADPIAWTAARARQDEIVRAAIQANDGFVFGTAGDAYQAAFSKVDRAVAAALSAQRGLQAERWPGPILKVRMGLHTGAAEWRDSDYEGYLTLAHTQRIMSAGHGGQVLLSQTAADLAFSELRDDLALRDLGEHRLKDLPRAERIFQLIAADLPADFPPLRTPGASPNNLPAPLTSFIGRAQELAELSHLLSAGRLLTLTGPGGTGKTRLALRLASDELEAFPDGAWFVELAALGDPTLLTHTVAAALSVQDAQGRSTHDVLVDFLRAKTALLILDNCEHLIEPCAQLADDLLRAAPHLKLLATSRESLGIAGETAFRVPSLPLPSTLDADGLDRIAANDCVRLFVDRAMAADPRFRLAEKNARTVSQICVRLDGIPLAIELAAARIKVFSPEQIAARLDDRFRLLTGGSRTALERHQTLLALIDWSHDLLSEDERTVLRRLSVFAGGWTLEAAQSVCASEPGGEVGDVEIVDTLARLADKSLVMVDETTESAEARYRLLETIRQYARDKLLGSGESERTRDRHLAHYLGFAEEAESHLRGADQLVWVERLETEHDNLRSALAWSLESADVERALRLAGAAAYFWELRAYWIEGHKWLDAALALPSPVRKIPEAKAAPRAKALYGVGRLLFAARIEEASASRALAEESFRLWRELGDKWWMAMALEQVGFMLMFEGDLQTARARFEEGVSLARQVEDHWPLALCLDRLAGTLSWTDLANSRRLREECVAIARSVGDKSLLSQALVGLAYLCILEGNIAAAGPIAIEALAEARAIGTVTQIVLALLDLALVASLQGDQAASIGYCRDLFALGRDTGSTVVQLVGVLASGIVECLAGDAGQGVRLLTAIEGLGEQSGLKMDLLWSMLRPIYKPALDGARSRLAPGAIEAAVQEGRTFTMEQAFELASRGWDEAGRAS